MNGDQEGGCGLRWREVIALDGSENGVLKLLIEQTHHDDGTTPRPQQLLLTVEEAAEVLRVGRTTIFQLIRTGELATVQIGRLRRVSVESLQQVTRERQG